MTQTSQFDFLLFLFVAVLSSVSPSTVLRTVVDSVAQGLAAWPVRMRASFVDGILVALRVVFLAISYSFSCLAMHMARKSER